MNTINIIAILAASYFNGAAPDVQAACAHASDAEMVACIVAEEISRSPYRACSTDADCAASNEGGY